MIIIWICGIIFFGLSGPLFLGYIGQSGFDFIDAIAYSMAVIFWPLTLPFLIFIAITVALYEFGKMLRRK